jgi:hypothetical protein
MHPTASRAPSRRSSAGVTSSRITTPRYRRRARPGQTAWVNLLEHEPLLIMLDEMPPYFENARFKPIGNSDLSAVTGTALANLFVALGKPGLQNVCLVITDLTASYQAGAQQINQALRVSW